MPQISVPDLTTYGAGGLTLIVAVYTVLQALKRGHPALKAWMPELVIAMAGALMASLMWWSEAFAWLAGTIVTAALVMLAHGGLQKHAKKPPE